MDGERKVLVAVRVVTVPMVMSVVLTSVLFAFNEIALLNYLLSIACLAALPLVTYLFTKTVPYLKKRGRAFERNFATVSSVVGYLAGFALSFFIGTAAEKSIYLTYLITGFAIGFSTFVFKFKASGHSAGIAGPVVALSHLVSPWFCLLGLVWLAAGYSSIKLLRHTVPEYLVGGAISVAATFLSFAVFGLI